jgi:hypothetical protein
LKLTKHSGRTLASSSQGLGFESRHCQRHQDSKGRKIIEIKFHFKLKKKTQIVLHFYSVFRPLCCTPIPA